MEVVQGVGELAHLRRGEARPLLGGEVGGEVAQGGRGLLAQVQGVLQGILVRVGREGGRRAGIGGRWEGSGRH
jgi:hypothetical protein